MAASADVFAYTTGGYSTLVHRRLIGSGGYGHVHELYDIPTGEVFARKLLPNLGDGRKIIDNETRAISKLCGQGAHINIVSVLRFGDLPNSSFYFIDMELCDLNLEEYIHRSSAPNPSESNTYFINDAVPPLKALQIWNIMKQITNGVKHVHSHHEAHRDLKPANILYSRKDFTWKVADFGITSEVASAKGRATTGSKGTTGYRAPELLSFPTPVYTNKVDIWSLGCILYELVVGKRLFYDDGQVIDLKYSGRQVSISFDESFSEHCKDNITKTFVRMLQVEPVSRPSAEYLFEEFSRNYQFPQVQAVESFGDSHNIQTKCLTDDISNELKIAEEPKEDETVREHPNVLVSRPTESDHLTSDVGEAPNDESTLTNANSIPLEKPKEENETIEPIEPLAPPSLKTHVHNVEKSRIYRSTVERTSNNPYKVHKSTESIPVETPKEAKIGATAMTPPTIFGDSPSLATSLGSTRYAQMLNKIIHELVDTGCEAIVRLPRIAVIGNQSSGKSSLIEAICQIEVPRGNGACTRCPMEVRLSTLNHPEWSGKIWLKKEVRNENGDTQWHQQLFTAVTDREEVLLALRRAQLALLNPSKDPSYFLRFSDSACNEAAPGAETKFSSNIVVLDITGADVDVSFIDLPGIIQRNTSEIDDVSMVKQLATSYAEMENCLILVVISMKDDIDNQAAGEIAKNADHHQQRTIGVLTKVDEVRYKADKEYWTQVALNKKLGAILHHGYYVTRLATPDELRQNPTWNESRQRERDFFQGEPIWGLPIRCGTELLVAELSKVLSKKIELSLRDIEKELLRQQRAISKELSVLPAIDEDPQTALVTLCGEFTHELGQFVDGNGSRPEYILQMRLKFVALQNLINETKPKVFADCAPNVKNVLSIPKVRKLINDNRIKHLPGDVLNAVILVLVDEFLLTWSDICLKWFEEVEELSKQFMEWLCGKNFANYHNSGLLDAVKTAIDLALQIVGNDTREKIKFCCMMEEKRPWSLNDDDDYCREFERLEPEVLRDLSLESTSGSPKVEVNIICNVYTHFHLASKRVIDTICMTCEIGFAQGLGEKMRRDLMLGIGNDGREISENLIEPRFRKKRELNDRMQIVERSLKVLDGARAEWRGVQFDDEEFKV